MIEYLINELSKYTNPLIFIIHGAMSDYWYSTNEGLCVKVGLTYSTCSKYAQHTYSRIKKLALTLSVKSWFLTFKNSFPCFLVIYQILK